MIGGATQTVRDLVAAWEQRDVMAREVAVDVASHSPQVDPILDELTDVLAELTPDDAGGSLLLGDPVRPARAAGVRCRLLGATICATWCGSPRRCRPRWRTATGSSPSWRPHPLLTHAVEQTARSLDMSLAALAGMRREQALPHGLRGLLADLHSAGAAVDFSVLYPNGRLVDAPLPTWTHRRLWLSGDGQESPAHGACTVAVHPLLGAHVRLQEEPERHVWQAEVGTAAQPWLGDHQIHNVAALPGAAYCEMALAAARAVLGEASEVRDIRFEQMLLLDEQTTVGAVGGVVIAGRRRLRGGDQSGRRASAASQRGPARRRGRASHLRRTCPRCSPRTRAAMDGAEVRKRLDQRGVQYGPAFTGLAAVHTGEGAAGTVLAEVALPGPIRSQQGAYGVHPALLDACFQSVEAHPDVQALGRDVLVLPLGVRRLRSYGSARNARYCYTRVTESRHLRGRGRPRRARRARDSPARRARAAIGHRSIRERPRDRVLTERLLTIEWQQRELPEVGIRRRRNLAADQHHRHADLVATTLTDALKTHGAQCTTMCWPPHADHTLERRTAWQIICVPVDSPVW